MRRTLLALVFVGCASTQHPQASSTENQPKPEAQTQAPPAEPPAPETKVATGAPNVIDRGELVKVLNASPGYFLQHVLTEPQLADGHFVGWRLVSFFPGDARFAGVDLQAGDVVTRINGQPIEQPDQFMAVWDGLRKESQLVVDVQRNGAARTLRWTIADK